eukprot:TRINITY_DN757_c0_g1_i1.p1 TRINITY_DN757_c0_g1~~TRINITY_DN757_c0_g1_i1.p1  ORF type:complete len:109 (+),score=13.33 TRINITY_DN757_c0_g1_i1:88-414(+)
MSQDDFEVISSNSQLDASPVKRIWTAGVGIFTAALPAYLFATVLDLSVKDYLPIYLSVTILSGIALSFAYQSFFVGSYIKFQKAHLQNNSRAKPAKRRLGRNPRTSSS